MPQSLDFILAQRNFKLKTGGQIMEIASKNGSFFTSDGRLYVRSLGGFADGVTTVKASPNPIRIQPGVGVIVGEERKVYVGIGFDGRMEVKGNVHEDLRQAGINSRQLNPNDPSTRYRTIGLLSDLASFPDGGTGTVMVHPAWYRKADGSYGRFAGQTGIDLLTSYTPATASNQLVACLWLNTATNLIEITASSEFAQTTDIQSNPSAGEAYIEECRLQAPAENIGSWSYIIRGDDTEVSESNKYVDLRGIIGEGGSSGGGGGYPDPVTSSFAVQTGYHLLARKNWRIEAGGSVKVKLGSTITLLSA